MKLVAKMVHTVYGQWNICNGNDANPQAEFIQNIQLHLNCIFTMEHKYHKIAFLVRWREVYGCLCSLGLQWCFITSTVCDTGFSLCLFFSRFFFFSFHWRFPVISAGSSARSFSNMFFSVFGLYILSRVLSPFFVRRFSTLCKRVRLINFAS